MHVSHPCKELVVFYLNLPHIPICSLWCEESCIFQRRPSRLEETYAYVPKLAARVYMLIYAEYIQLLNTMQAESSCLFFYKRVKTKTLSGEF